MFDIQNLLKNPLKSPVFFVAELGINHDGDLKIIKNMIDRAAESKADAVKFQLYQTDQFYNALIAPEAYQLFDSFCVSYEDFLILSKYAESKGLLSFAAPFDTGTLSNLVKDNIFPIKIASGDAITEPWIDFLLEKNVPFIISTGSLTNSEIQNLAQKIRGSLSAMLYCVSEYPAPPEGFDIRYLNILQSYLPDQAIGFSDHSQGYALSLAAVSHQAKIVERHFTIFPERTDLDHPVSLSPESFFDMVQLSRTIEKALGSGQRNPTEFEKKIRNLAGRDAYAAVDIPAQAVITEDMIILQRPGQGITSIEYKQLLGKTSSMFIKKGTLLRTMLL